MSTSSAATKRVASAPRPSACELTSAAVSRSAASTRASASTPTSLAAAEIHASHCFAATPSARPRRRSAARNASDPSHSRSASVGTGARCTNNRRTSSSRPISARPAAGSMICTSPATCDHSTTKCASPPGDSTTAIAGSDSDSARNRWSTGTITCSASRPSATATSSSVSIDVPSTSV